MLRIRREHVERNFLHLPPTERPAGFEPKPIPKEEILLIRVRLLGSGAAGWDFAGAAS